MDALLVTDGLDNIPGAMYLDVVPFRDVDLVPEASSINIEDAIELKAGKSWYRIEFTPGKLSFGDTGKFDERGSNGSIEIQGFHPYASLAKGNVLFEMRDDKYLVLIYDYNGDVRLCGSVEFPCMFYSTETFGEWDGNSVKGYFLKFFTESNFPALYYQSVANPVVGSVISPAVTSENLFWINTDDYPTDPPDNFKILVPQLAGRELDDFAMFIGTAQTPSPYPDASLTDITSEGEITRSIHFPPDTAILIILK